jgi:hypothetical protein
MHWKVEPAFFISSSCSGSRVGCVSVNVVSAVYDRRIISILSRAARRDKVAWKLWRNELRLVDNFAPFNLTLRTRSSNLSAGYPALHAADSAVFNPELKPD